MDSRTPHQIRMFNLIASEIRELSVRI